MIPFLRRELIRQHATEAKVLYEKLIGRPVTYPLNVEDFFMYCLAWRPSMTPTVG
jgi:hypothetical protein